MLILQRAEQALRNVDEIASHIVARPGSAVAPKFWPPHILGDDGQMCFLNLNLQATHQLEGWTALSPLPAADVGRLRVHNVSVGVDTPRSRRTSPLFCSEFIVLLVSQILFISGPQTRCALDPHPLPSFSTSCVPSAYKHTLLPTSTHKDSPPSTSLPLFSPRQLDFAKQVSTPAASTSSPPTRFSAWCTCLCPLHSAAWGFSWSGTPAPPSIEAEALAP